MLRENAEIHIAKRSRCVPRPETQPPTQSWAKHKKTCRKVDWKILWNWLTCNDLTNFIVKRILLTGNGSYVNLKKLVWKKSWKHINWTYLWPVLAKTRQILDWKISWNWLTCNDLTNFNVKPMLWPETEVMWIRRNFYGGQKHSLRHKVGPNIENPPKISMENFVKLTDLQRFDKF